MTIMEDRRLEAGMTTGGEGNGENELGREEHDDGAATCSAGTASRPSGYPVPSLSSTRLLRGRAERFNDRGLRLGEAPASAALACGAPSPKLVSTQISPLPALASLGLALEPRSDGVQPLAGWSTAGVGRRWRNRSKSRVCSACCSDTSSSLFSRKAVRSL